MSDPIRSTPRSSPFIYLLNAFEQASQSKTPFEAKYAEKRKALLDYVFKLEASHIASETKEPTCWQGSAAACRDAIIEECAKVCEQLTQVPHGDGTYSALWTHHGNAQAARAIRALKGKANG